MATVRGDAPRRRAAAAFRAMLGTAALVLLLGATAASAAPPPVDIVRYPGVREIHEADCRAALAARGPELMAYLWPFAVNAPRPITARLVDSDGFRALGEGRLPDWGVGVAVSGTDVAVDCERARGIGHQPADVLMHELGHALLAQAVGGGADVPRWFHEGVAQRVSGEWRFADTVSLVLGGRVPPLGDLDGAFPSDPGRADRAYRTSLLAVKMLERWHGEDAVLRILRAARLRGDFAAGFVDATGETLGAFSRRVASSARLEFGWLVLLTRWPTLFVIMALVFGVGAGLRIARARRRLEAMADDVPELPPAPPPGSSRPS